MKSCWMLLLLFVCMGCGPLQDPCESGSAACFREQPWQGPPIPVEALEVLPEISTGCKTLRVAELVDLALKNNPITYRTWADARAAAFNWEASKSLLYPTIELQESLTFNANKSNGSLAGAENITTMGTIVPSTLTPTPNTVGTAFSGYSQHIIHNLTVSYLLLDFGGRDATIDAARHALFYSNWLHNRSLQDVIIAVLRAYYSYEQFLGLYQANLLNLRDAKVSLDSAQAQFEAGVKTHVDFFQAKANYVNFQLALEQSWGNLNSAMGQLASAVGVPADTIFEVEPIPEKLPVDEVTANMEELLEEAKQGRPDLAAAYANYQRALANVEVAQSSGLPTVTANVNYEWVNNIHIPSQNSSFRSGSITLNIPIFSGFLYINQERQAIAEAESAFAILQQTESQVLLDVVTAYYAFTTAGISVKFSEDFLKYAQEAYNGILIGYQAGTNSITDLLTNQTTLSNARAQLVQAKTQWLTSIANLAYATGVFYEAEGFIPSQPVCESQCLPDAVLPNA